MSSSLPVALFLVPFVAALAVAMVGWRAGWVGRWLAPFSLGVATVVAAVALLKTREGPLRVFFGGWAPPLGIEWSMDVISGLVACLVSATSAVVLIGTGKMLRAESPDRETSFYVCALLLVSGLLGMTATADLFNFYVHLEVAALSSYALVAAGGRGAPRAAIRYLVAGTLGATLYLLGVGLFYAGTGSLNMSDVSMRIHDAPAALATTGCVLIVVGLSLKMALFPLHAWMPDAYARSTGSAAALMAPLVTKVSAYALLRIVHWVCAPYLVARAPSVLQALAVLGAAAMVYGSGRAFLENDLRRALALSSVSQIGLVAAGVGLGHRLALTGALIHLVADAVAKAALFLAAGCVGSQYAIREIGDLRLLRHRAPLTRLAIGLAGLSLVGIPPFVGFFGKWYLLVASIEAHAVWIAAALIAGSLLTAALVFRIFEQLFFAPAREVPEARPTPWRAVIACSALAVTTLVLGIEGAPVLRIVIAGALPRGA